MCFFCFVSAYVLFFFKSILVRNILKNQGVATIQVTHDQLEANKFSEKLLLMQGGKLLQSGTPIEIYQYPKTLWASSPIRFIRIFSIPFFASMVACL